jgi:DNA-binding transcriptional MerR regulator
MEKAADAFRTISEVAEELNVPKHVLRFWEGKFTHIKPMKRGGGRRYYRPEDVELLRGIRQLLHEEGYTIKGVQKQIRQSGIEFVKAYGRGGPELPKLSLPPELAATRLMKAKARARTGAAVAEPQTQALDLILRDIEACRKLIARLA